MTCNRDLIYDFVDNPEMTDPVVGEHLESCPSCMELYGSLQEFAISLADPSLWAAEEPVLKRTVDVNSGLDRLVSESLRMAEEEFRAAAIVEDLAARPLSQWHARLRSFDGVCTVGLVRALVTEARARVHTAPREFESIASLAIEVADTLVPDAYAPGIVEQARGMAWKERANALRVCGDIQDALWSLDEAERHYRLQPIPEFDLAIVNYVRATVLNETDRLTEALTLAQRAGETFLEFGDERRTCHAGVVEATILRNLGSSREARQKFMTLLKPTQQAGDLPVLAMLFINVAHCSVDIADADTASIYFLQALNLSTDLGLTDLAVASRWGLGRLLLAGAQYEQAIERLRGAAVELERMGAEGDVAIIQLEILEALVALERFDEIPAIARKLVDRFSKNSAQRHALVALSYLREAVETRAITPEIVHHVRSYVERLPKQPELLFLPPPG